MDLTIRDLTVKDKTIKIHDNLMEIPYNSITIGRSACGKTNMILNLIGFYKTIFKNHLLIFTKSRNGSLYSLEKSMGAIILNDDETDVIEKLLEYQRKRKEENKPIEQYLILFDDYISSKTFDKKNTIYGKLFSMARHFNISIMVTAQSYLQLPAVLRRLAWYIQVFDISNTAERKAFISENCNALRMNERDFERVFNEATEEKYSFLSINVAKNTWTKNFGH